METVKHIDRVDVSVHLMIINLCSKRFRTKYTKWFKISKHFFNILDSCQLTTFFRIVLNLLIESAWMINVLSIYVCQSCFVLQNLHLSVLLLMLDQFDEIVWFSFRVSILYVRTIREFTVSWIKSIDGNMRYDLSQSSVLNGF